MFAALQASFKQFSLRKRTSEEEILSVAGVYLANQLDGKIFDQPGLMPTKESYSDFVQTKVQQPAVC